MKSLSVVATFLISLLALCSCESAAVKKLKTAVSEANSKCPKSLGDAGTCDGVEYNEDKNEVIFTFTFNEEYAGHIFLDENKETLENQVQLALTQDNMKQVVDDIIAAKASLVMIYKSKQTGKKVSIKKTYEDLKEIQKTPVSSYSTTRSLVENTAKMLNAQCPVKIDDGITQIKIALEGDFMVYYIQFDENLYDFDTLKTEGADLMKEEMLSQLENARYDKALQNDLKRMSENNIGLKYRIYGNDINKYIDIDITPNELAQYITY